ncbi:hypothetical protein HK100_006629 [Physocladia obscura]|uniref:Magnesium transporter n=1 Tax=Physocladia obscura TaxID=109957 RepID=A0AAD5XG37_9FUNG|nr:hypothetical protein HK100_006629 [Physocladia obscura]
MGVGILLAILAASLIGTGQTIQKAGITETQTLSLKKDKQQQQPWRGRSAKNSKTHYSNRVWQFGIGLSYLGEALNFAALGQAPAGVVVPLNAVAVVVGGLLGVLVLKEPFDSNKLTGFLVIIASVSFLVLFAPSIASKRTESSSAISLHLQSSSSAKFSHSAPLGSTPLQVLDALSHPAFLVFFLAIFAAQTVLIHCALFRRSSLPLLTCICALFGTCLVVSAKAASALVGASLASKISLYSTEDAVPTLLILATIALGSAIIQEFFKQEALARYSISTFQPLLFAAFNVAVIASTLVLFHEYDSTRDLLIYLCVFCVAISGVLWGSHLVQVSSASGPGSD